MTPNKPIDWDQLTEASADCCLNEHVRGQRAEGRTSARDDGTTLQETLPPEDDRDGRQER
jgi:hypothetical protein